MMWWCVCVLVVGGAAAFSADEEAALVATNHTLEAVRDAFDSAVATTAHSHRLVQQWLALFNTR